MGSTAPDVLDDDVLGDCPPREAERLREVWTLAGPAAPTPAPSKEKTEEALAALRAARNGRAVPTARRPDRTASHESSRRSRRGHGSGRWKRRAAAALGVLVLLAAIPALWWMRPIEKVAPPGERLTVTLPDGSTAELNSGSRLRFRNHFIGTRAVMLEGEAFFDVAEREAPFVVETFNAKARAVGTRFAVRAWPEEPGGATRVALASGHVVLVPEGEQARAVRMTAGEAWVVETASGATSPKAEPADISVREATAWRRGELVFKNARLGAVLGDIERRFGTALRVAADSLRQRRISLAIREPTGAEAVVRDVALALGLRYRDTARGFEMHAPTPSME